LSHQFSGQSGEQLKLVSHARQFSSMLVLVGRIASASTFEPKYAAIVQNKDELQIPLDMSTIPTPKEFKDAIESLSPEQQNFAKAFRSMQLESTLLGVLIIHIKPQLETVLNLPDDSLTKEIKLTQDLMHLFIRYQIPSDLMSFDGTTGSGEALVGSVTVAEQIEAVKSNVKAMTDMLDSEKKAEIEERQREALYEQPFGGASKGGGGGGKGGGGRGKGAPPPPMMAIMAAPAGAPGCASKGGSKGGMAPNLNLRSQAVSASTLASAVAPTSHGSVNVQQEQRPEARYSSKTAESVEPQLGRDYTRVPEEMDKQFQSLDTDGALRPTIISPGKYWRLRRQKTLLAAPSESTMGKDDQKKEKDAALDLLDALTKSGALPIEHASLHIVIAATHCFDKTVTETVVHDNVSPIDKVERSTLIMASTVYQQPACALIRESQVQRVRDSSPLLF